MKKVIVWLLALVIIMAIPWFVFLSKHEATLYIDSDDDLEFWFRDIDQLLDASDLVVVVETEDPINRFQESVSENDNIVTYGMTVTNVKVKKVLKSEKSISIDDVISIVEPYFFHKEEFRVQTIKTINGYRPMLTDSSYLLFLHQKNHNDYYYFKDRYQIVGFFQGKIPMAYLLADTYDFEDLDPDQVGPNLEKMDEIIKKVRRWYKENE